MNYIQYPVINHNGKEYEKEYIYLYLYLSIYLSERTLLSHKKEWNNAIYSNMDGPRDDHTKWSQSERETNTIGYYSYVELKKWYTWTYLQNRNRLTDTENKLMVTKEERVVRDKLGVWDQQIHTSIYKIDRLQGPTV